MQGDYDLINGRPTGTHDVRTYKHINNINIGGPMLYKADAPFPL